MSARIISTVGRAIDVIVAGRLVSHLRFAAGVCVLAAGLLMGGAGGAVAVADPDSSGSAAPGDGGTNASGQVALPQAARSATLLALGGRRSARNEHAWLGPATRPAAFHRREKPEERAWRHGHQGRDERPGPRRRGSRSGRAVPNAVAPVPDGSAPVPDAVAPVTDAVAPVPDAVAPVPMRSAPVADAVAPVPDAAAAPVPDAVGAGSQSGRAGF